MTIRTAEDMREAAVGICAALLEREYDAETGDSIYGILDAIRALPVASEWRPIEDADWYASVDYWREVYLPPINCTHACIRLIEPNQAIRASHDATHWRPHVAPGGAA
jgi:hypothetical protein